MDKFTILIVDDDPLLREIFATILNEYDVHTAANCGEAVECYKNCNPNIVLMDIAMEGIDGIETTKRILGIDPKATIIGLTAFSRTKGNEMLQAGAAEIISKPVRMVTLKKIVSKYLRKK